MLMEKDIPLKNSKKPNNSKKDVEKTDVLCNPHQSSSNASLDFISAEYLIKIGELEDVHSKAGERVSVHKTSSTS